MRNNGPLTGKEVDYPSDLNILSVTDAKGHITYCNQDFIKISGFKEAELIGQPHNLVRHPDVPALAFADLWNYLKAQRSWMGMVKNRCKNGDHYWVDAFATPIFENGQLAECQSVRSKPERSWVNRAEALYAKVNAGRTITILWPRVPLVAKLLMAIICGFIPLLWGLKSGAASAALFNYCLLGLFINVVLTGFLLAPLPKILKKSRSIAQNKIAQYVYTGRMDEFGEIELAIKMLSSELGAIVGRMSDASRNQSVNARSTMQNLKVSADASRLQNDEAAQMAAGLEEMSASMKEISRSASDASTVAANAVSTAAEANEAMTNLNEYGVAIGNVMQLITSIAEQTNLLALNATIEAARAGEAGKGFAVVASEVKELASQTAKASEDVGAKIESIQAASLGSLKAMNEISQVIDKINHYQTSIAAAVEEQSAVTSDMTKSITTINTKAVETSHTLQATEDLSVKLASDVGVSERLASSFRRVIQSRNSGMSI